LISPPPLPPPEHCPFHSCGLVLCVLRKNGLICPVQREFPRKNCERSMYDALLSPPSRNFLTQYKNTPTGRTLAAESPLRARSITNVSSFFVIPTVLTLEASPFPKGIAYPFFLRLSSLKCATLTHVPKPQSPRLSPTLPVEPIGLE